MRNSFGNVFTLTSFGESHGNCIGGVIDGMPSGIEIDENFIQNELNRRKPGNALMGSARKEADLINIHSGVFNGVSTGSPIAFTIENTNARSADYDELSTIYRPSHADFTTEKKYNIRNPFGGGRSSARLTAIRCAAGAFAKLALKHTNISITAFTSQIGDIVLPHNYTLYNLENIEDNYIKCPDKDIASRMEELIKTTKQCKDSIGGVATCVVKGCPIGIGEPEFNKLHAALGYAMLGINAAKGFEIGAGFKSATMKGSEHNDCFNCKDNKIYTATNNSGGVQWGISNGEDIYFNVAFKPIPTIGIKQNTINTKGENVEFIGKGRHDSCVLPRVLPVIEAMTAITLLDYILLNRTISII